MPILTTVQATLEPRALHPETPTCTEILDIVTTCMVPISTRLILMLILSLVLKISPLMWT